ncbi:class I SAM-dependent methyltransferase [Halarcobacter bivalviorum]|uniref:SAM-dependent methyltransferase n=1 Tax=Halarcobacter bivalviorum TaxID=663364 RepID=A0AAX2A9P2_9BACT|nr:class I SAM-dependent methyltransferase [Halarcobacter bivalviorum]AXH12541.1 SAM-dependent methyltransferase [Halarcobacter bivalviorum]RXK10535.1 SAM-dependent methyltransferase [Halarcobacter bivalviorum]
MNISELENLLKENLKEKTKEFKRIFHGRGNLYDGYSFLTIDSIDKILFATFFEEIGKEVEEKLLKLLESIYEEYSFECLVLQRRYLNGGENEILKGILPREAVAWENGLKYQLNFSNKNIGYFADMKNGREFITSICEGKNILNLFSYTCAFSVAAINAGAKQVVNVDMAKNALNTGRENHRINSLDSKNVKFLPFNILKSWSKIRKFASYDIIIIDPPSFQKGSFAASKDYRKIIKKLDELAAENCIVLSCLNAPELDSSFIRELFQDEASSFRFIRKIDNLSTFPTNEEERSLKNLVFQKA